MRHLGAGARLRSLPPTLGASAIAGFPWRSKSRIAELAENLRRERGALALPLRTGADLGSQMLLARPLRYPVRPDRRGSAGQQRDLSEHCIHEILQHGIVQINVRWKMPSAAGINELRPVQRR